MTCTLPFVRRMASDFDRAKELLVGAVDTVIQMANQMTADSTSPLGASGQSSSVLGASASSSGSEARRGSTSGGKGLEEHRRLFSFAPSKASRRCKGKTPRAKRPKRGPSTWRKDCVCLRSSSAKLPPSTTERMVLASMGLGLKEIIFDSDGDEGSIDGAIYSGFPKLIGAEGYKLMRHSDVGRVLVDIIVPEGGMTVPYLKDIVRQARLYVSPGKSIPLDRDKVHVHKIECWVSG